MIVYSDSRCLGYEEPGHPERPARVEATARLLERRHPEWMRSGFAPAPVESLLLAHSQSHLDRLQEPRRFDPDTAYHEGIYELARLAAGGALAAMEAALAGKGAFSLMRPPGHHAERDRAMGFCYLNHAAICALEALRRGVKRVAVWDFDAHHGNGTEAILLGVSGALYVSVHQHPCFPGTGAVSRQNSCNFPVPPGEDPEGHLARLAESWGKVLEFDPELVLVSAGFDAYVHDPITQMSLRETDFRTLGRWLAESGLPAAAVLEGGYSDDLPDLVDGFLTAWSA